MPDRWMTLQAIEPKNIDFAWRDGASKLAEACKLVEEITGEQLKMILSRGERTLIEMRRDGENAGWGTIRVDQLPNVRVLHITDLYAPKVHFEEFYEELRKIAIALGCSKIRCAALPAQERLYEAKCGFKAVYQIMEREV